jgi:hypothetical protein
VPQESEINRWLRMANLRLSTTKRGAAVVEESKRFLKEHAYLLPKLSDDGDTVVSWPSEALRFLWENYTPEDIRRPYVGVASPSRY